jgi:phenylpyruvate tautomerase PptA (4-oxalocrotonate tautomerase family)
VKKHENKGNDLLIITFDDEKTTLKIIINELSKGNFIVNGEPVYLK